MPDNIDPPEELCRLLNGIPVELAAPVKELDTQILGRVHLENVQAILTAGGLVVPFELDESEARAVARGKRVFLIHFHGETLIPFRILFERVEFEFGTEEKNGTQLEFQEPDGPEKTD